MQNTRRFLYKMLSNNYILRRFMHMRCVLARQPSYSSLCQRFLSRSGAGIMAVWQVTLVK